MSSLLNGSDQQGQAGTPPPAAGNPPAGNVTTGSQLAPPPPAAPPSWRDSLPEDLKGNGMLQQFSDVGALAKSYVHAQSLIGKKGVIPPTDRADEKEWNEFFSAIGRPELDKYSVMTPENTTVDPIVLGKFKEVAHKAGLLPKQAQEVLNWYSGFEQEVIKEKRTSMEQEQAQQIDGLKKEWGEAFEKHLNVARLGVKEIGGPDFMKYLDETGLANDVRMVKFAHAVGKMLGEDKLRGNGHDPAQTPSELDAEYQSIIKDPAFYDPSHKDHARLKLKAEGLAKKIWKS